jgi:quercetin dioxygenase-like cupin family protein
MRVATLNDMKRGWFVGNFEPTLVKTNDVEVAVKEYKRGDYEEAHYHKLAKELTVIVYGSVRMNGVVYKKGDIIVIEPGDVTDFEALENTACTVVKYPGASDDKYLKGER